MTALKYTDRDVRENEDFVDLAAKYLSGYEGEFEFLIDCKMRIASGRDLTVGMVRGVLNCMRVDPRLDYDLPDPLPPEEGRVVPFPIRPRQRKKKRPEMYDCPLMEAGVYHRHKRQNPKSGMRYCVGLYRINRNVVTTALTVNMPYAKGKSQSTTLIHKVSNEPVHVARWYPKWTHEYGFGHVEFDVKLVCKIPSWLTNPMLLTEDHFNQYNADPWLYKGEPLPWTKCPRCFPKESN